MKEKRAFEELLERDRLLRSTGSTPSTADRSGTASCGSDSPSRTSRASLIRLRSGDRAPYGWQQWLPLCLSVIFIFVLAIFILLLVLALVKVRQEYTFCQREGENPYFFRLKEDREKLDSTSDILMNSFDASNIRENLRWLSKNTHISGTAENTALLRKIADEYISLGFQVRLHNYTVLLNYPDFSVPNTVEVQDEAGKWWSISQGKGRTLGPPDAQTEQSDPRNTHWWTAYSGNGTAIGPLVYCNYGMTEDFDQLQEWDTVISGAIALIRYGGIPRAEKVREAERRGAIGVILFSDPVHYTTSDRNRTFPHDVFLPGMDAQRGTVLGTSGDPLTPVYPSLPYTHRSATIEGAEEKGFLPRIPLMPISYDDANRIMGSLNGKIVESPHWRGGLPFPYRLSGSRIFRLRVRSRNAKRTITNVIATLKGREEADKWVLVGNHVDAWGKGAIDPLSGTATQLEMARVAAKVFLANPPRRSIVFCHWDAEEYGLIGSTEWLEEMQLVLNSRAIAYVNVDHIAGNTTLDVKSVPLLYRVIVDAAKRIPQLNSEEVRSGRTTLLDSWRFHRGKGPISGDRSIPEIGLPAGGSDYQRFISFSGIPSLDLKMESSPGQSYALYHTMYETFWTVDNIFDPNYSAMLMIGQLWMEITHRLANQLILPFDPTHLAQSLSSLFHKTYSHMVHLNMSRVIPGYRDKVDSIKDALRRFHLVTRKLQVEIQDASDGLILIELSRVEQLNSRLQYLERSFLDPFAFDHPINRHLLFSPSRHPPHVSFFPALLDLSIDYRNTKNQSIIDELCMSFTRIQYAIESAIILLSFD